LYSINKLSQRANEIKQRANEIKDSRDGALPTMLKEATDDGNSFALSSTVKTPSKMTNKTFVDDNSTNLSYSEARSGFSKISDTEISMLSGFSSPSETDNL
jgi:hypothetical protein